MKKLLTSVAICALLIAPLSPLFASQHMKEGQGGDTSSEEMMQEQSQEMEREHERTQSMGKEESHGMEQREMTQEQKEMGKGTEEGEKEREHKWWRFWE